MSTSMRQAINAYSEVAVETGVMGADPRRLVLMLYEGARAAVAAAHFHMQRKEIAAKGEAISKAINIIDNGLAASLDMQAGGELALQLRALYDYMSRRLLDANLRNDHSALEEVGKLLAELHGAWEAIRPVPTTPLDATQPA